MAVETTALNSAPIPHPPGWGNDSLTDFCHGVHCNVFAASVNLSSVFTVLKGTDKLWVELTSANLPSEAELPWRLFASSAKASYRSGCILALGGLCSQSHLGSRGIIENCFYAAHVKGNFERFEVWRKRAKDELSKKAARQEFTAANTKKSLKIHAAPADYDAANSIYESTIDFGAHPNPGAIFGALHWGEEVGDRATIDLMNGNHLPYYTAIKTVLEAGLCGASIMDQLLPGQLDDESKKWMEAMKCSSAKIIQDAVAAHLQKGVSSPTPSGS